MFESKKMFSTNILKQGAIVHTKVLKCLNYSTRNISNLRHKRQIKLFTF